jgi:hypothetical protein
MTTTTSKDKEWDDAPADGRKITGGFDGRVWVPHLSEVFCELRDDKRREKIAKIKGGAVEAPRLKGRLREAHAWGRAVLILDAQRADGTAEALLVPDHGAIYTAAAILDVSGRGAAVVIEYLGRGEAKPGRTAPHRYSVTALEAARILAQPRANAARVISRDEREAAEKARSEGQREARGQDHDEPLPADADPDADLPF